MKPTAFAFTVILAAMNIGIAAAQDTGRRAPPQVRLAVFVGGNLSLPIDPAFHQKYDVGYGGTVLFGPMFNDLIGVFAGIEYSRFGAQHTTLLNRSGARENVLVGLLTRFYLSRGDTTDASALSGDAPPRFSIHTAFGASFIEDFNETSSTTGGYVTIGLGLDRRLKHRVGVFADARLTFLDGLTAGTVLAGLRFG